MQDDNDDTNDKPERNPYSLALLRLSVREYGAAELRRYLLKKGFDEESISEALSRLQAEGSLDESRYIAAMVRSQANRDKGPAYIRQKLQQKGVRVTLQEVKEVFQKHALRDELTAIQTLIDRRYPDAHENQKTLHRAYQALVRRGFSADAIRKVLKDHD